MKMYNKLTAILFSLTVGLSSFSSAWAAEKVTVFAASSLTNAVKDVAKAYEVKTGVKPVLSFASSSALARQIAQGAPADIYLSANQKWMDYLYKQQAMEPQTRRTLLKNSLVVVAPKTSEQQPFVVSADLDLQAMLQGTRLAVGNPAHVPVGRYAQQSLESLGLWSQAQSLLARANNARSALVLVERGEAELGLVYSTDAKVSQKVRIVSELPEASHKPIEYPLAMVKGKTSSAANGFYEFLQSKQARQIFVEYGFGVN